MASFEFSPADMRMIMLANERVIFALSLTDTAEHMVIKTRISSLILECAEGGERDLQKLIDCAHAGLLKS